MITKQNDFILKLIRESLDDLEKNKNAVHRIYSNNSDLNQIGTEEQYYSYLDTIFPNSKIKDIVYHGTNAEFDKFKQGGILKGSFFTNSYENAEVITQVNRGFKKYNPKILSVMLDIRNPYYHKGRWAWIEVWLKNPHKNNDGIVNTDLNDVVKGKITEYVIFKPEQAYILGNAQDVERFKNYINQL